MDQHRPARTHAITPGDEVVAGWAESVRAVDVEQVNRSVDRTEGSGGQRAHVLDDVGHAMAREVGVKGLVVVLAALMVGRELLRAAVGAKVGIDAETRAPAGTAAASTTADFPRKEPISTTVAPPSSRCAAARRRSACASVSQPSISVGALTRRPTLLACLR